MLRPVLRLFRAHTSPYTVLMVYIPLLYAGRAADPWSFLLVVVVGTVLHMAGFGMNTVTDWLAGFDKRDEGKRHFPVGREISEPDAVLAVSVTLIAASVMLPVLYVYVSGSYRCLAYALAASLVYVAAGVSYNIGVDHLSTAGPAIYAISYGSLAASAAFAACGGYEYAAYWFGFGALSGLYQIGYSGWVKDYMGEGGPGSELVQLPAYRASMLAARVLLYLTAAYIAYRYLSLPVLLAAYTAGLAVLFLALSARLHMAIWGNALAGDRLASTRAMGLSEILSLYYPLLVLLPLEPVYAGAAAVYGIAWYAVMNRLLWGVASAPRV